MTEQTKQHLHSVEAMLTERLQGQQEQQEQMTALFEQFQGVQAHPAERFAKQLQAQKEQTLNTEQRGTPDGLTNIRQFKPTSKHRTAPNTDFDKGAFVRSCLTENPTIRNADIQRRAQEMGQTISPAYISEVRKAFESQSGTKEVRL